MDVQCYAKIVNLSVLCLVVRVRLNRQYGTVHTFYLLEYSRTGTRFQTGWLAVQLLHKICEPAARDRTDVE